MMILQLVNWPKDNGEYSEFLCLEGMAVVISLTLLRPPGGGGTKRLQKIKNAVYTTKRLAWSITDFSG